MIQWPVINGTSDLIKMSSSEVPGILERYIDISIFLA